MAYIVSYESAGVDFPKYINTRAGVDVQGIVSIKGGAGVISKKGFDTPKGVITEVSDEDLAFLKTQYLFNEKVKHGSMEIVESEKKATEKVKKSTRKKDQGAQLTAKDFEESGLTPPIVGANEKPDDGSGLKEEEEK